MTDAPRYHFVSRWALDAPPADAYAALYEVTEYPAWWPEIKEARRLSEDESWLRTRSALPYDLSFHLRRTVADPERGILDATLKGDLDGRIIWTIEPTSTGCLVTFDEDVVTTKRLLNTLAPVARVAFSANHTLMMAHGHAGLRTFLAGYRLAKRTT